MKNFLKNFGLEKKEIQYFEKILELGPQSVSVFAKNFGVPRSTAYFLLENLKNRGLVENFDRNGIKYFRPVSAENLQKNLQKKEEKILAAKNFLQKNLEKFKIFENKIQKPKIRFFENRENVKKIYDEILREKKFCAFANLKLIKKFLPKYFSALPLELQKNRGTAREILVDCDEAREYQKKFSSPNHEIKILPQKIAFPSDTIITNEKIFMISYDKFEISAIEIWNKILAATQKIIFDEIWEKF